MFHDNSILRMGVIQPDGIWLCFRFNYLPVPIYLFNLFLLIGSVTKLRNHLANSSVVVLDRFPLEGLGLRQKGGTNDTNDIRDLAHVPAPDRSLRMRT